MSAETRRAEIQRALNPDLEPTISLRWATPRQRQILRLYAQTGSMKEFAGRLGIQPGTVKDNLRSLYRRTGMNRIQALYALGAEEGGLRDAA